jgi:hypothetical protein
MIGKGARSTIIQAQDCCAECGSVRHTLQACPRRSAEFMQRHGKEVAARLLEDCGLTKEHVLGIRALREHP